MTDKPRTFDIKFDSAGDFDKARELIERMNAALAEKDRRIEELESEWRVREGYHQELWNNASDKIHALEARIERMNAALAAKDRRIEELGGQLATSGVENLKDGQRIAVLQAQIDRVRALADRIEGLSVMTPSEAARLIRAAISEPAATPKERP